MNDTAPSHLYKYRKLDKNSESLLSGSELYFSRCSNLNDPFEGRPHIQRESNLNILIEQRKLCFMRPPFRMNESEAHRNAVDYVNRDFSDQMAEATWDYLDSSLLYAINQVGILCLSAVRDNALMWAHYAAQHAGFCIEFNAEAPGSYFNDARKMRYQDDYPIIRAYEEIGPIALESTKLALLTKSSDWKYEQEYRILMPAGPKARPYREELMTGVYFGCRMSDKDKEDVKSWVSRRKHPVKLFQGKLLRNQYLVEFDEIK